MLQTWSVLGRKQQGKIQKLKYMSGLFLLSKIEMEVHYPDEVKLKLEKPWLQGCQKISQKNEYIKLRCNKP